MHGTWFLEAAQHQLVNADHESLENLYTNTPVHTICSNLSVLYELYICESSVFHPSNITVCWFRISPVVCRLVG